MTRKEAIESVRERLINNGHRDRTLTFEKGSFRIVSETDRVDGPRLFIPEGHDTFADLSDEDREEQYTAWSIDLVDQLETLIV